MDNKDNLSYIEDKNTSPEVPSVSSDQKSQPNVQVYQQDIVPGAVTQPALVAGGNQKGDMYYGMDGVRFSRLGIGNSGQVLMVNRGLPTWITPASVPSYAATYGVVNYSPGSNLTTASTSYAQINAGSFLVTITPKVGKLVMVCLNMSGVSNSNAAYATTFNIGLDGASTTSSSGGMSFNTQNGSKSMSFNFFFTSVSTSSHSFYPLWLVVNAADTAQIDQYAICNMSVVELMTI